MLNRTVKLGKKPAVVTERSKLSELVIDRALAHLGPPPIISDDYVAPLIAATGGNLQMLGNDAWGDCVQADSGHALMVRTANEGPLIVPTAANILALYSAETGFNPDNPNSDQGTDMSEDCEYMTKHGLLGHKAAAYGSVNPSNQNYLKWCIQLFGGCRFGVNFPQSAMDQFNATQPWTIVPNDGGIIGGHDVIGVKYDAEFFYCISWGQLQPISPDWLMKYMDESWVMLWPDWFSPLGDAPSGFNLGELLQDLRLISISSTSSTRRQHRRRKRQNPARV